MLKDRLGKSWAGSFVRRRKKRLKSLGVSAVLSDNQWSTSIGLFMLESSTVETGELRSWEGGEFSRDIQYEIPVELEL